MYWSSPFLALGQPFPPNIAMSQQYVSYNLFEGILPSCRWCQLLHPDITMCGQDHRQQFPADYQNGTMPTR